MKTTKNGRGYIEAQGSSRRLTCTQVQEETEVSVLEGGMVLVQQAGVGVVHVLLGGSDHHALRLDVQVTPAEASVHGAGGREGTLFSL